MSIKQTQTKKQWLNEKTKIKTIFASYILGALLYLGSDIYLDNMKEANDYFRGIFVFTTVIISAITYIIIGKEEFKLEDLQDEIKSNKEVRHPETLVNIIKKMVDSIVVSPEEEIKSLTIPELNNLKKKVEEL